MSMRLIQPITSLISAGPAVPMCPQRTVLARQIEGFG